MKRTCFTIIEITVVIAIIALLMAILVPALRSSRLQVRTVLCSSNIRQLQLGLSIYESENRTFPAGFFNSPGLKPPPGGYAGKLEYDRTGWWWFNFIEGLYKKSQGIRTVLQCPAKLVYDSGLGTNILCGNYGVNRSICKSSDDRQPLREEFVGTPLTLSSSSIPYPSQTLLIVDSGYSLISWWHATNAPPVELGNEIIEDAAYIPGLKINKERQLWPGQEQDAIYGRHPDKTVNVGFADGHIDRVGADELFVEKTANGYINKTPLWQPN
jgi:prepilin-type processing-associated H-X9-DG protein